MTITITSVQTKRSSTPGARPATLLRGEEFVNLADDIRLFGDGGPVGGLAERPALRTGKQKLGIAPEDFGDTATANAFRAALTAAVTSLAGKGAVRIYGDRTHSAYLPDGTTLANQLGSSGVVLDLDPTASITVPAGQGAGALDMASGAGLIGYREGASKDVWYWGRRRTGAITSGVGAINAGFSGINFQFDTRGEDVDMGVAAPFFSGFAHRHIMNGGSTVRGGRQGLFSSLFRNGPTSTTNVNRNYAAGQFSVVADSHDTGNLGNYRGSDFGLGAAAYASKNVTFTRNMSGVEVNTFTASYDGTVGGPSVSLLTGAQIVACNATRGVELDAALSFSGLAAGDGYGPHAGWNLLMAATNAHGVVPTHPGAKLFGTYWEAGVTNVPIAAGFDLSGFAVAGALIQGQTAALSETALSFSGNQVVGLRQAAIANATDAATTQTRVNAVLAALRAHGLIAP